MTSVQELTSPGNGSRVRTAAVYALELAVVAGIYVALAKTGLGLASINPSASPIWPPTGFALAALLLRGYRLWPAILVASFAVNLTTAGSLATSLAIGFGNTLEALLGAWLVNSWSGGRTTFDSPAGVARFVSFCLLPTALAASIGVTALSVADFADWQNFGSIWLTWWLGDLAGALVITPAIVLWAAIERPRPDHRDVIETIAILAVACVIGLLAFGPVLDLPDRRAPLAFLAVLPLLWSALRRGPRETATVALILCGFAVWGTASGGGPFGRDSLNESLLMLLMFMIGVTVPSLALSADAAVRRRTEAELRATRDELNRRVETRTAALSAANRALEDEIERRKHVEMELDHQTRHLMEAQRLANLGSWMRNLETNEISWSDQLYEIFGVERGQEFAGTFDGYLNRVHPEDRERVRDEVKRAVATGEGFRGERRIVRPNGEIRHLQTCVEVIKNDVGRVIRMHGIGLDVTERKQAEMALERTREQLAQAQKMEAIGQLTGGIAHDFNNLLMIVSGHAEMLRRKLNEPKALNGLDAIIGAARRGEGLTRQLLTFSRRQPLNPVPIDMRSRIDAMGAMLNSSLRGNITLAIDLPDDLWPVEADVAEFELALVNIAVNARDAMPDGGIFTISARNVPAGRGLPGGPTDDHVELSMRDTGTGIPPDVMKKIFDPFFTTKAVGKGTGLGLSQVYGFANQSGGSVGVRSDLGRGTNITLHLPRSRAEVVQAVRDNPHRVDLAEGTILVVEDNPDVAAVTATLLEQIGYRVLRAEDAPTALEVLAQGEKIDLLFSDIVMPNGMNGIHLAQEVLERYPSVRILLTTGYSDVAAAGESRFPILRKPFELAALEHAVRDSMAATDASVPRARAAR